MTDTAAERAEDEAIAVELATNYLERRGLIGLAERLAAGPASVAYDHRSDRYSVRLGTELVWSGTGNLVAAAAAARRLYRATLN